MGIIKRYISRLHQEKAEVERQRESFRTQWANDEAANIVLDKNTSLEYLIANYQALLDRYGSGYLVFDDTDVIAFEKEYGLAVIDKFLYADKHNMDWHQIEVFEIGPRIVYVNQP